MKKRVRYFSLMRYLDAALRQAEYYRDENGVVIAEVPNAPGFYAQGDSFEDARNNLRDVVEGNVLLALQLGFDIPAIAGVAIEVQNAETLPA